VNIAQTMKQQISTQTNEANPNECIPGDEVKYNVTEATPSRVSFTPNNSKKNT